MTKRSERASDAGKWRGYKTGKQKEGAIAERVVGDPQEAKSFQRGSLSPHLQIPPLLPSSLLSGLA